MNKIKNLYYKRFFNYKFNFYSENELSSKNLLFVDRQRIDVAIPNSILTLSICKKKKLNAFILSDEKNSSLILKIYKHLGFKKFLIGFNYLNLILNFFIFCKSVFYATYCILKIKQKGFEWLILKYKVNNILIGDLIYDTNIRYFHRYIKPSIDIYFIKLLIKSTFRLILLVKYFNLYNFKSIVIGSEPYSYNSGIALRIAISKNIKNYSMLGYDNLNLCINNYDKNILKSGLFRINKKLFNSFKINKNKLENFYKNRFNGQVKNLYTRDLYVKNLNLLKKKKLVISKNELLFLKKIKNINKRKIVFACHTLSDAVHTTGVNYIFKDYFDQLKSTLDYIKKTNNYHWIIKAHPQSKYYNEYKIIKKFVKSYKLNNIDFCPPSVKMKKLIKITDYLITGMGTSAVEYNAEKKISITCGSSPFSHLGISYLANTKKQYFNYIINLEKLDKIDKKKQLISKKIIYFLEKQLNYKKKIKLDKIKDIQAKKFFGSIIGADENKVLKLGYEYLKVFKDGKLLNELTKLV